jgi:DNA-binding transcriptional MerR regulator
MARSSSDETPIGIGYYTVPEAGRLVRIRPLNIRRWLGGYRFEQDDQIIEMPPLWKPQLPGYEHHIELGFRDLIELRFIKAFLDHGLGLRTIRHCLEYARECVKDDRPFSTRRFQTDGKTIFLDSLKDTGDDELLDLRSRQYVIKKIIERTFKDLVPTVTIADAVKAEGSVQRVSYLYGVSVPVIRDAVSFENSLKAA